MGTNVWQSVDNNWNNAANWSLGAKPASTGDTVIIPATATIAPGDNLDQTGTVLDALFVMPGCNVGIGTSGNPLIIGSLVWKFLGNKDVYLIGDGSATNYAWIGGGGATLWHMGGTNNHGFARVTVVHGHYRSEGSTSALTWLQLAPPTGMPAQATITNLKTATTILYLVQSGGIVDCSKTITHLHKRAGITTLRSSAAVQQLFQSGGVTRSEGATNQPQSGWIMGGTLEYMPTPIAKTMGSILRFPNAIVKYDPAMVDDTGLVDMQAEGGL